jgi:hypothetical protein
MLYIILANLRPHKFQDVWILLNPNSEFWTDFEHFINYDLTHELQTKKGKKKTKYLVSGTNRVIYSLSCRSNLLYMLNTCATCSFRSNKAKSLEHIMSSSLSNLFVIATERCAWSFCPGHVSEFHCISLPSSGGNNTYTDEHIKRFHSVIGNGTSIPVCCK